MKSLAVIFMVGFLAGCTSPAREEIDTEQGELLLHSIQPVQRDLSPLELSITGYQKMHLKGRIKKIEERFYSADQKNGTITKTPLHVGSILYQDNIVYFNEEGMLIKRELLNGKDIRHKSQFKYDPQKKLIKQIDIMPWDKSLVYEQELTYGLQDRLIRRINTYSNMSQSVHLFTYDTLHHRIIERNFTEGILISKKAHIYNEQDNLVEQITYVPPDTDTVLYELHYQYDSNGNVKEEINELSRIVCTFDEPGMPIKCEEYNLANNQLTGIETYSYILDSAGNWTEKTIFVDGKPFIIAVRTITYF